MFKVQSHTMWLHMCLCCGLFYPRNSISIVVVSVTIHDDTDVYVSIYKRCSKKYETIVEGQRLL